MRIDIHHYVELSPEVRSRFDEQSRKLDLILRNTEAIMAAIDQLKTDIGALISEAVNDLTAAVAAAQAASNDPAIDALDQQVTATTQALKDKFATLGVPVAPAPPTPAPGA